ncbi:MAG: 5'-3' exonuclease H3TH domain-containing protein, partial [candidate division WOR-3 bacterium]
MNELFIIIDGTSLAYRAFFAFIKNPLRNTKGENTSAPFAFTNSILKIKRDYKPSYMAIVFDAKGKTKRHVIFEKYKATRPPMPNELVLSLKRIREITEALNLEIYEVPGYEADDVIASLVNKAKKKGWKILILSSDKDLLQIVDDDVWILDTRPKEDIFYTKEKVIEKFGIEPGKIPDYLALIGDNIDNIPGVSGIGEKTAVEIVNKFKDINDLIENYNKIENLRIRKLIEENIDNIKMAKELTKLDIDIDVDFDEEKLKLKEPDYEKLFKILREL